MAIKSLKIAALAGLIALFFWACSKPKECFSSRYKLTECPTNIWWITCPPGTKMVRENFFADRFEISNLDYREYLYWTEYVFGRQSVKLIAAMPDTSVWLTSVLDSSWDVKNGAREIFFEVYFGHPAYNFYPVVGLTIEQVEKYAAWRSDRVLEMNLIRAGVIQPNPKQDSAMHFSIENYLNGHFWGQKPSKKIPFPVFRLPTINEWEEAAAGGLDLQQSPFGLDFSSRKIRHHFKKGKQLFATSIPARKRNQQIIFPANAFLPNDFGLHNAIGNVAEMTSEKGIAKGGSWHHPLDSCRIDRHQNYSKPEAWLGFRLVCSWEFSR